MKITPSGHRVLLELIDPETKSKGGIIIAGADTERAKLAVEEGIVISLGINAFKDFSNGEPWCKIGDTVMIARYAGVDKKDPNTDKNYRVVNDEDIVGVIEYD